MGPDALFPPGTYLSETDGRVRKYYAEVSWAALAKIIQAGVYIEGTSTTGEASLVLEWTFDGDSWKALTTELLPATSSTGLQTGDTGTQNFGNRARLVMGVGDSASLTLQSVTIRGGWASGKPF